MNSNECRSLLPEEETCRQYLEKAHGIRGESVQIAGIRSHGL
jgi:hypothetical protein